MLSSLSFFTRKFSKVRNYCGPLLTLNQFLCIGVFFSTFERCLKPLIILMKLLHNFIFLKLGRVCTYKSFCLQATHLRVCEIQLCPPQRPPTVAPWLHTWEKARGGWEEGKINARGEQRVGAGKREKLKRAGNALPVVPRAPVFSLQRSRFTLFFFHWCLLTGASAEERGDTASERWSWSRFQSIDQNVREILKVLSPICYFVLRTNLY